METAAPGTLIDVTEDRQAMASIVDNSIYGNMSDMIKTQTGFAITGAVAGYCWSVSHRTNWMPWTFAGLLGGALLGWGVSSLKGEN